MLSLTAAQVSFVWKELVKRNMEHRLRTLGWSQLYGAGLKSYHFDPFLPEAAFKLLTEQYGATGEAMAAQEAITTESGGEHVSDEVGAK